MPDVEDLVDPIRALMGLAITIFLVILRFEAEKFGAAEYDEPTRDGHRASFLRRLSWFLLGFALVGALLLVYPNPRDELGLSLGDRGEALLFGFGFGAVGTLQAAAYAFIRYGRIRFPPGWTYPGAYTLATRTGAPGRGRYMFVLTLVGGFVLGWVVVVTGAIGAAFLAHAITRIAVFVCTGHAGQPARRGEEIEESWEFRRPPPGWRPLDDDDDDGAARGR